MIYLVGYLSISETLQFAELQPKIKAVSLLTFINLITLKFMTKDVIFSLKKDLFTTLTNLSIIIYYFVVLFIQFFSIKEIQTIIKSLFKNTRFQAVEKSYMDSCNDLSTITEKLDVFVLAHLLGWFVKGCALRNFSLLTVNSILFELCELKFQHILPNFYECWWDHIIMDILGCNGIGIILSLLVLKWINYPLYQWNISGNVKRRTKHIYFNSLDKICRRLFYNSSTLLLLVFCCIVINVIDINVFFLKAELQLPTTHILVFLRTLFISFIAMKAAMELNNALTKGATWENMIYIFSLILILFLEIIVCIKWRVVLKSDDSDNTIINTVWLLIAMVLSYIWVILYINETTHFDKLITHPKNIKRFLLIKNDVEKKK